MGRTDTKSLPKGTKIVITGQHPQHGQVFDIKEWRDEEWVLTNGGHLLHIDYFEPCSVENTESLTDSSLTCQCHPPSSATELEPLHLDLEEVRRDGGTQPRTKMDLAHIKRLEEQMENGHQLEPVVVFYDGESYWLADGFHRWNAHRNQEEPTIQAYVYQGTRRDAVLYSVGANADHKPALPRTNADKRRAVLTLLNDPEWQKWSDREIARICKVDHKTVGKIRKSLTGEIPSNKTLQSLTGEIRSDPHLTKTEKIPSDDEKDHIVSDNVRTYRTKHGTISTMNTGNIGKGTQEETMTPPPVKVSTDDILIAFLSNLEYMNEAQVEAAVKAIASSHPDIINALRNDN